MCATTAAQPVPLYTDMPLCSERILLRSRRFSKTERAPLARQGGTLRERVGGGGAPCRRRDQHQGAELRQRPVQRVARLHVRLRHAAEHLPPEEQKRKSSFYQALPMVVLHFARNGTVTRVSSGNANVSSSLAAAVAHRSQGTRNQCCGRAFDGPSEKPLG